MRTWVEISRSAYKQNWSRLAQAVKPSKPMAIFKANAYGHGLLSCLSLAIEMGVDSIGVDSIIEAQQIRYHHPDISILVLGYIPIEDLKLLTELKNVSVTIFSKDQLIAIEKLHLQTKIHLPLETGLSREGFTKAELIDIVSHLKKSPCVLEGVYSHLANVEDVDDRVYTDLQKRSFEEYRNIFNEYGFDSVKFHLSASGAAMIYPDLRLDIARIGIAQYGLWPSERIQKSVDYDLEPVLAWKTKIAQVKSIGSGAFVSYGLTEQVTRNSIIAIIPVGYYDGYDRVGNSSKAQVLIQGKRCKVVGRVCMNMCMVDVTDCQDVRQGDEVVLIGKQGEEHITADELAGYSHTIHYEIVTRINESIPRVFVD